MALFEPLTTNLTFSVAFRLEVCKNTTRFPCEKLLIVFFNPNNMDYGKSIPRADLLIKKKELERVIDDATKRLGSIDEVLKMFPPEDTAPQTFQPPLQKKLTNYERAEDVLKGRQVPMRLKDLYAAYLENGGQTKRASFDVSLGKWLKHPKKKIVRIDKGIYQYRS